VRLVGPGAALEDDVGMILDESASEELEHLVAIEPEGGLKVDGVCPAMRSFASPGQLHVGMSADVGLLAPISQGLSE
jgi:hypothetical protein